MASEEHSQGAIEAVLAEAKASRRWASESSWRYAIAVLVLDARARAERAEARLAEVKAAALSVLQARLRVRGAKMLGGATMGEYTTAFAAEESACSALWKLAGDAAEAPHAE